MIASPRRGPRLHARATVPPCVADRQVGAPGPASQFSFAWTLASSFVLFVLLCGLKRLYFEADIRGWSSIRERLEANQLRAGLRILAHARQCNVSTTLDHDRDRKRVVEGKR